MATLTRVMGHPLGYWLTLRELREIRVAYCLAGLVVGAAVMAAAFVVFGC